jgi:hypothetical protein
MFIVKSNSAIEFIEKHIITNNMRGAVNTYSIFKDEIYIRKEGLPVEMKREKLLKIFLPDKTESSNRQSLNCYLYELYEYDHISLRGVLTEFKVVMPTDEQFSVTFATELKAELEKIGADNESPEPQPAPTPITIENLEKIGFKTEGDSTRRRVSTFLNLTFSRLDCRMRIEPIQGNWIELTNLQSINDIQEFIELLTPLSW